MYSPFCYNAYLENENLVQHGWYIRNKFEHNTVFHLLTYDFICEKTVGEPASQEYTKQTFQTPTSYFSLPDIMSHTHLQGKF